MYFVWISETAIISLYSISWLVFITETECVYCEVRTETSDIIQVSFCFRVKLNTDHLLHNRLFIFNILYLSMSSHKLTVQCLHMSTWVACCVVLLETGPSSGGWKK
jgi:hypothetical protein